VCVWFAVKRLQACSSEDATAPNSPGVLACDQSVQSCAGSLRCSVVICAFQTVMSVSLWWFYFCHDIQFHITRKRIKSQNVCPSDLDTRFGSQVPFQTFIARTSPEDANRTFTTVSYSSSSRERTSMICSKFIRTLYRARMQLLIGRTSYSEFYLMQAVIVVLSINTQCMYDCATSTLTYFSTSWSHWNEPLRIRNDRSMSSA
jgi:hypothetical protein